MIVITKRAWPSLELRARIARRRKARATLDGVAKHVIAAIFPSAEVQGRRKFIDDLQDIDEANDAELEEFATHVKACPDCKAELARAARAGAYVPEKLLIAAGIEILRN